MSGLTLSGRILEALDKKGGHVVGLNEAALKKELGIGTPYSVKAFKEALAHLRKQGAVTTSRPAALTRDMYEERPITLALVRR